MRASPSGSTSTSPRANTAAGTDVSGGAAARRVEVGSLNNGTAYTFQVRAVDTAANDGAAGTTDAVTPVASSTSTPGTPGAVWSATLTVSNVKRP